MSDQVSSEMVVAIRTLVFERVAQINRELVEAHNDIAQEINVQNHYAILALLDEATTRIQETHTILIFFRACLEG